MFIPDPGSWFLPIPSPGSRIPDLGSRIPDLGSRIPDPKTATKERGEKKIYVIPFYVATNFTKLWSEIRKKPIPDTGSRGQKGTGSRIRIRNYARKYDPGCLFRIPDPRSLSRRAVFLLRISPRIRSQNRNGPKGSVRDLCRTDLCKNNRGTSASLPCPFNDEFLGKKYYNS